MCKCEVCLAADHKCSCVSRRFLGAECDCLGYTALVVGSNAGQRTFPTAAAARGWLWLRVKTGFSCDCVGFVSRYASPCLANAETVYANIYGDVCELGTEGDAGQSRN